LVNVFLFGNEYAATPFISKLFHSQALQDACVKFIALTSEPIIHNSSNVNQTPNEKLNEKTSTLHQQTQTQIQNNTQTNIIVPPIDKIIQIYCSLRPGIAYREISIQFDSRGLGIDDRKLIIFGEMNQLIRIHRFAAGFPKQFMEQK
jgi:hypothetical protein